MNTTFCEPKQFLTINQAAQILNVSPQAMRSYLREEKIDGFALSKRNWRVSRSSLFDFIKDRPIKRKKEKADFNAADIVFNILTAPTYQQGQKDDRV